MKYLKQSLSKILPIFIIPLLLLSGCVQTTDQTGTVKGSGIVITDFSSSRDYVEGKDRAVRIYMEVENQGGYATDKVLVCLIGSFGEISESMWKLEDNECQKIDRKLEAYDPTTDMPGGTARKAWTLKSPWVPYPQESDYTFTGRVYYFYRSMTSTKIKVYSESEIEAARQRGETLSSVEQQVKTISPIDITISAPTLLRAEDGYFTIRIQVSNVGGGIVFDHRKIDWNSETPPSLSIDDLNYIKLNITYPKNELDMTACETEIELKKGETRTISCDFEIKDPESITTWKSYPITVEAEYGYYVDKDLLITVKGKKGETAK